MSRVLEEELALQGYLAGTVAKVDSFALDEVGEFEFEVGAVSLEPPEEVGSDIGEVGSFLV